MKKVKKRLLAFALVCSVCFSTIGAFPVQADTNGESEPEFKVIGASIRFVNENTEVDGIRFGVGIRKDIYDNLTSKEKKNYRLLVMPSQLVQGELEKGETYTYESGGQTKTAKAMDVQVNWKKATQDGDYVKACVFLNGIDKTCYDVELTARAYYQEGDNEPIYTDAIERSYITVANGALNEMAEEKSNAYPNKAGDKWSPYTKIMRNSLLGVTYEKATYGTWDLHDLAGKKVLTTVGATTTDEGTLAQPFLLDREKELDLSEKHFVIETSIYVPAASDAIKGAYNGFVFGYGTAGYWLLDVNYRNHNNTDKWLTNVRYFGADKKEVGAANKGVAGVVYEEGWYDYRISIDKSDSATTKFIVEYKKQAENKYTTLINTSVETSVAEITGTRVGYFTTINEIKDETTKLYYDPDIQISNGGAQLRGAEQKVKLQNSLATDGTGRIQGSFIVDKRTVGNDNSICREGIVFSGTDGKGYQFFVSEQPQNGTPRLYAGLFKYDNASAKYIFTSDMVNAGTAPSNGGTGLYKISENDEYLVEFLIDISINSSNQKEFDVSFTISGNEFSWTKAAGTWIVTDKGTPYTSGDVYLYSNDTGKETDTNSGDGKIIFYPITVSANTVIEKNTLDTTVEAISLALEERERYTNPIPDENQPYRAGSTEAQLLSGVTTTSKNGSMSGDPYILRYNGKYYLYVSTNDWWCSYRCWESLDLIHYTYLGQYNLLDKNGNPTENDTNSKDGHDLECPWAPEVHYWNGKFYMYTSPHASGHIVLESTTGLPYGDYKVVIEEFATNIDGTVFIDDNEDKWFIRTHRQTTDFTGTKSTVPYLYIQKLDSMTALNKSRPDTTQWDKGNLSQIGITGDHLEGPFMFKRNGIYYMISAGEGVGHPGYRLNYAYNTSGLGNALNIGTVNNTSAWSTEMEPNVIINTEGDYTSYGHGAMTIGPNLDSYWFPYHMTRANGTRILGINRVEFSGTRMTVSGQDKETMVPDAPDFYTSYFTALSDVDGAGNKTGVIARDAGFRSYTDERTASGEGLHEMTNGQFRSGKLSEDGNAIVPIETGSQFTAEYSFKLGNADGSLNTSGDFKCLFGGGYVTINGKTVDLYAGTTKLASATMTLDGNEWDADKYHDIIVTYKEGRITVSIDGCTKIDTNATGLGDDTIGFAGVTREQIGGAVFSNQAFGSSDKEEAKMVDGSFYACNYYEAKEGESASNISANSGVYTVNTQNDAISYSSSFGTEHTYHIYKDATALKLAQGDRAVYKIDVAQKGWYTLESLFSTDSDGSVIKIQIDNDTPTCYTLRKNNYSFVKDNAYYYTALEFQKRVIDKVYLTKGVHTLTVKAVQGNYTAIEYEMNLVNEQVKTYSNALSAKNIGKYFSIWKYADGKNSVIEGTWTIQDGVHLAASGNRNLVRVGDAKDTDYRVKVDIKTSAVKASNGTNAGIMLRMTQPSISERQTYGSSKGYYICLDQTGVSIMRFDYNEILVAHHDVTLDSGTYYTLEAECVDNVIHVYLDGKQVLTYIDPYGFANGAAALYSNGAETYYKNLVISPK